MIETSQIIPLFVAIPLGGAFLTSLTSRKLNWLADILGIGATLTLVTW